MPENEDHANTANTSMRARIHAREEFDPEAFIAQAPWRLAKAGDHSYTIRGQTPDAEFDAMVVHIREHGYRDSYVSIGKDGRARRYRYTYLNVGPTDRFWTIGWPVHLTTIINRARRPDLSGLDPQEQNHAAVHRPGQP